MKGYDTHYPFWSKKKSKKNKFNDDENEKKNKMPRAGGTRAPNFTNFKTYSFCMPIKQQKTLSRRNLRLMIFLALFSPKL